MRVLIAVADLLARSRIEAAARAAGHEVIPGRRVPPPSEAPPDLLLVDLDASGAMEALEAWRNAHPDAPAAGFAFHVNRQVIDRAKALGVRVLPHGADPTSFF